MRYVHTNLVARDWRRLAGFYVAASASGSRRLELVYARDPEGNLVELQSWRA